MIPKLPSVFNTGVCKNCQKKFLQTQHQIFCSVSCYQEYRHSKDSNYRKITYVTLICPVCKKEFKRNKRQIRSIKVYCSHQCAGKDTGGFSKSTSPRIKRSVQLKCNNCGKDYTGRENSKYCCKKCGGEGRGNRFTGKNNPNYRHGQNGSCGRATAKRNYEMKCIVCGFDTAVVVHHIIPKADNGTNDPENLAVLCPNHHAMVHKNMISSEELTLIIKGIANNLNLPVSGS
jgi:hypothetical protein